MENSKKNRWKHQTDFVFGLQNRNPFRSWKMLWFCHPPIFNTTRKKDKKTNRRHICLPEWWLSYPLEKHEFAKPFQLYNWEGIWHISHISINQNSKPICHRCSIFCAFDCILYDRLWMALVLIHLALNSPGNIFWHRSSMLHLEVVADHLPPPPETRKEKKKKKTSAPAAKKPKHAHFWLKLNLKANKTSRN